MAWLVVDCGWQRYGRCCQGIASEAQPEASTGRIAGLQTEHAPVTSIERETAVVSSRLEASVAKRCKSFLAVAVEPALVDIEDLTVAVAAAVDVLAGVIGGGGHAVVVLLLVANDAGAACDIVNQNAVTPGAALVVIASLR